MGRWKGTRNADNGADVFKRRLDIVPLAMLIIVLLGFVAQYVLQGAGVKTATEINHDQETRLRTVEFTQVEMAKDVEHISETVERVEKKLDKALDRR